MQHRVILAGIFILIAACAQRLATPASTQTSAAPDETFDCVRKQLAALKYQQSSIDIDAHRINATKIDMESRRSDTQFRRILNKLEVEVAPQADGRTGLKVLARTFAEYTTQRGPTEVEEKASEEVRTAAQQLLERCSS
jgi:hypothetical protein